MKAYIYTLGIASIGSMLFSAPASATTESTTASATFISPIAITVNTALNFGTVLTSIGQNETLIVDTTAAVTGTGSASYLDSAAAGDASITGSDTQGVDIILNNSAANGGVSLSLFTCSYDGGAESACDSTLSVAAPTSLGKTLLFGGTATFTAASYSDGDTASPSFDIVVTYQ
jgi:hypothetical protein